MTFSFYETRMKPTSIEGLVEPTTQGLVITTADLENDQSGQAFLWYVGRPRSIHKESDTILRNPIEHEGRLLVVCGRSRINGLLFGRGTGIGDLTNLQVMYRGVVEGISSWQNQLIIAKASTQYITTDEKVYQGGFENIEIGVLQEGKFRECMVLPRQVHAVIQGTEPILHTMYPYWWPDNFGEIIQLQGTPFNPQRKERFTYKTGSEAPYSIGIYQGAIVLGKVGELLFLRDGKQAIVNRIVSDLHKKWEDLSLRQILSNLGRSQRPSNEEIDMIADNSRPILKQHGIALEDDCELYYSEAVVNAIEEEYAVRHIVEYNGEVFYAMGRRLYSLHQDTPLWTFRNTITGLGVLSEELLKKTKGKASVRRGRSAMRTMMQRAA
ncbi:MAG: hypothetical protein Q8L34_02880 [Candidatus Woesearchaeota archaeon]|nr:hypothetical protein [Candidatus Woesearchaeota archaeon]